MVNLLRNYLVNFNRARWSVYSAKRWSISLFSPIDIFGLKKAYDKLSNNGVVANIKLSEVLEHYYGQTVPSDNNTFPSHYTKRFRIFCEANGLLASNGTFNLTESKHNELINRIKVFTIFYYNALDTKAVWDISLGSWSKRKGTALGIALYWNAQTFNITGINWKKDFSSSFNEETHIIYVLSKFMNTIEEGLLNEN